MSVNIAAQEFKSMRNESLGRDTSMRLENAEYIGAAVVSKTAATVSTYPFQVCTPLSCWVHLFFEGVFPQVLRTRLQNNVDCDGRATSMFSEGRRLLRVDPFALYRGLVANLVRVMPATCTTFVVYENVSHFLEPREGQTANMN